MTGEGTITRLCSDKSVEVLQFLSKTSDDKTSSSSSSNMADDESSVDADEDVISDGVGCGSVSSDIFVSRDEAGADLVSSRQFFL